jgi:hypothetical protein
MAYFGSQKSEIIRIFFEIKTQKIREKELILQQIQCG